MLKKAKGFFNIKAPGPPKVIHRIDDNTPETYIHFDDEQPADPFVWNISGAGVKCFTDEIFEGVAFPSSQGISHAYYRLTFLHPVNETHFTGTCAPHSVHRG